MDEQTDQEEEDVKVMLTGGPLDGAALELDAWVSGLAVRVNGQVHWYVDIGEGRDDRGAHPNALNHWKDEARATLSTHHEERCEENLRETLRQANIPLAPQDPEQCVSALEEERAYRDSALGLLKESLPDSPATSWIGG
jgi:hypothetical protein